VSLLAGNVAAATGGAASPPKTPGDPESSIVLQNQQQHHSQERLVDNRLNAKPPDDSTTTTTTTTADGDNGDANEHSKQAAAALVNDALTILRALEPSPSPSTYIVREGGGGQLEGEGPDSLLGLLAGYIKRVAKVLLLYTPSTLEEPVDSGAKVIVLGERLATAVEKLETAGRVLKSPDAIYLLAQMNFVGSLAPLRLAISRRCWVGESANSRG